MYVIIIIIIMGKSFLSIVYVLIIILKGIKSHNRLMMYSWM